MIDHNEDACRHVVYAIRFLAISATCTAEHVKVGMCSGTCKGRTCSRTSKDRYV